MNPQSKTSWRWTGSRFAACNGVPLTDRGFRYGMAVFESFPVFRGRPLFLDAHYERLRHACAKSGLEAELSGIEALEALLREVEFDAYARIYATAGDGGLFDGTAHGSMFVFVEPRNFVEMTSNDSYKLVRHPEPQTPIFGGMKTANYWPNLLAMKQARSGSCDEALLFNMSGGLYSASMANMFVVQAGKIKTPATASGARPGVIREWVMHRREVHEDYLTENDLVLADEIFLTNSWIGVMPVASLDGTKLKSRETGAGLRVEYYREITER